MSPSHRQTSFSSSPGSPPAPSNSVGAVRSSVAAVVLAVLRRGVVPTLVGAGLVGVVVALAGGPLPH